MPLRLFPTSREGQPNHPLSPAWEWGVRGIATIYLLSLEAIQPAECGRLYDFDAIRL
jgi:hypothetical protein